MITQKDLLNAYMAGFVDADGSISIKTQGAGREFVPFITVCNTNMDVMEFFYKQWGNGKKRQRKYSKHPRWKPCMEFTLTAKRAAEVIRELLPYLRNKRRQAELVLRIARLRAKYNGSMRRWNPDIGIKCDRVYQKLKDECKRLNKRGVEI